MDAAEWKHLKNGKGISSNKGGYLLVVKETDAAYPSCDEEVGISGNTWWWGVYEDADDLFEEGNEGSEEAAKESAEDVADFFPLCIE